MLTSTFYKILNTELTQILNKNPQDSELHKHKNIEQNKGYAFLIWFLEFYGQNKLYKNYITDGKDDFSCDIIFSNKDVEDNNIFYVIQSKWLNLKIDSEGKLNKKNKPIKAYPQFEKEEFKAVLSDFATVADGTRKHGKNEKFNKKYDALISHLERNGKAKFVFFTAASINKGIDDNINTFNREHAPNIKLIVIDINKIKRDYIEFKYKDTVTTNPLEYTYSPEDKNIELEIERYKNGNSLDKEYISKRDILQFEGRMQAYIFSLKPKTIHKLFKRYKFNLFFKNVRNPLHNSNYNEKIIETLTRRPDTFWYFNNGITAITKRIPDIGNNANTITVKGLQVINGAQTIYSIYQAYEKATYEQREVMDTDARVSFRLIRSSDEDFNLEITRYTNSQNAMYPRDFVANQPEQLRLQLASFETSYWYEKRRDEFRKKNIKGNKYNIEVVSNEVFALAYVAFYLQRPTDAILNQDNFFIKRTEHHEGLYEVIFNEHTSFDDMLSAFLIFDLGFSRLSEKDEEGNQKVSEAILDLFMPIYALSYIVLQKYYNKKFKGSVNLSLEIKKSFRTKNIDHIKKVLQFCQETIFEKIEGKTDEISNEKLQKLMTNPTFYEIVKQEVEDTEISVEDIESIELEKDEKE